ncbi:succinylglutamate desuccinylase/aspartoacylase family protein [Psychrosphaera ytuae]|uniref:Succinylglutamate desuccinylase/aspartoacylase family protein n=1 Tax=Psychrosphaera ytuae TaxID=2820710 RepID=A0A975HHG3_9GAMM|nr:M14 family metallopeptidase [Psychrosphaera ytuae]QTH63090.1 succinylglutamate desuccinylase/aspartoacylase family protein [Psychrosphaera ytuae]
MKHEPLFIDGNEILPGTTVKLDLPVAKLYTDADVTIPVQIFRAKRPGPTVFISAAIHGDELNGIEIIRRFISNPKFKLLRGTLIAVPMVNVYGVVNQSRYMPDRRDLNRSFPGSAKGSLASRVANKFMTEIVQKCDYGIDLHTGAIHRSNLPQIRANLKDPETNELAQMFGVPVVLNSELLEGSLREAAADSDTKILLYEAGEALRFDEFSIRAGVKGLSNILRHFGMLRRSHQKKLTCAVANSSKWYRASASGIVNNKKSLGDKVEKGDVLAEIGSPYGEVFSNVIADKNGIVIGMQNIPLVQEGEAMFHIAFFSEEDDEIVEQIETVQEQLLPELSGGIEQ